MPLTVVVLSRMFINDIKLPNWGILFVSHPRKMRPCKKTTEKQTRWKTKFMLPPHRQSYIICYQHKLRIFKKKIMNR